MASGPVELQVTTYKPIVSQAMEEIRYARSLSDHGLVNALVVRKRFVQQTEERLATQLMRLEVAEREAERRASF